MRSASAGLEAHYASDRATIATCWKITRRDGAVYAFTDHVSDLPIGSVIYSASTGYNASAIESSDRLNVDNLEIDGYLDAASITKADLLAGRWDLAAIEIFDVNYTDLTQGILRKRKGWIGEVSVTDGRFVAELRGLTQAVQQSVGRIIQASCDANVGDARCGLNLASITDGTVTGTLTDVAGNGSFTDSALTPSTGWFDGGRLEWTSGANDGLAMEVRSYTSGGAIVLKQSMPFPVAIGDGYSMTVGCDKKIATCRDKFANVVNFRGFPHVPGANRVLSGS